MTAPRLFSVSNLALRISANRQLLVDDFSVATGQHCCLFGQNGAGKTLLSTFIQGKQLLSSARINYADGFDPIKDIQVVSFEAQQKLCQLDARHDISEFNASASDQGTRVIDLVGAGRLSLADCQPVLDLMGIAELAERGIRYLSSGQLRRAMIARALIQKPSLLILDEPLESIDKQSAQTIRQAICEYMAHDTATLLLLRRQQDIPPSVTHLAVMDELRLVCFAEISEAQNHSAYQNILGRRPLLPERLPDKPSADLLPPSAILPDRRQPLIQLGGVTAAYGGHVVINHLVWQMDWGDHVLIDGPNGSGKSTLLGLLTGENHKAYGQPVYLFGRQRGSGESVWDIKAHFGIVSNELHNRYIKGWRVLDVVVSGFFDSLGLYQNCTGAHTDIARQWLALVDLLSSQSSWYHELSFGEQRLVLLARAMVKQPLILILDEPCVGLDDFHAQLILELCDVIAAGGRTHVVYVSHTTDEAPGCINKWLGSAAWEEARK